METLMKCKHCGKPYTIFKPQEDLKLSFFRAVQIPSCDCEMKIEKAKRAASEHAAKRELLNKLFENSLMTPFFRQKTFEFLEQHAVECGTARELDFCKRYVENFDTKKSSGLYFVGHVGTGKTSLLAAVANALMGKGYSCLFMTMSALLDKFTMHSYEHAGDISALINWLVRFDFIVIDDIGRGGDSERRQEIAYRIVDSLVNYQKVVCFTANPEIVADLKRIPAWGGIIDRLKDLCRAQMEFKGKSIRGRKWKM